jgi:tellurite resistance protein TerC
MMIAGAPLSYWIGFHVIFLVLVGVDLALGWGGKGPRVRTAALWTGFLVMLALGFAGFILHTQGSEHALQFISGYVLEASLSIDNLFVFLVLFDTFGLTVAQQHRALLFGVLGAIVLRALFIVVGVALLSRFEAVHFLFGLLLIFAAWRLVRQKKSRGAPSNISHWLKRRGWHLSPFLLAVITIELTDLVFAIDSVPAVLGITRDPFLVYTSNIFAVLGLRSMYFVLRGLLHRLHLLHYGLALVLAFVGAKMLVAHWFTVPTLWSLVVILGIVAGFAVASLLTEARQQRASV